MKDFEGYKDELNKCSKCGLCETVCPLFKITPNDCVASKGKFIMLHGVAKGDLKITKNINKYIDMCLKCGKCKDFCPASIDICEILAAAKYEYMKNKPLGKVINFIESPFIFDNIINTLEKFSLPFRKKMPNVKTSQKTVAYFKGCVNKVFPQNDNAISKIFKNTPIKILEPDFKCCGIPFLSEGNTNRYFEVMHHNSKLMQENNADYIVTDCASCQNTLKNYGTKTPEIVNWGDLIANENLKFEFSKHMKVTFHKPCHLDNEEFFEKIIKNCSNVEYIKMDGYDDCCGFAGTFAIKNPRLSKELLNQKISNIKKTNADFVITTCPLCQLGLTIGLTGSKIKVMSLLEFLAMEK